MDDIMRSGHSSGLAQVAQLRSFTVAKGVQLIRLLDCLENESAWIKDRQGRYVWVTAELNLSSILAVVVAATGLGGLCPHAEGASPAFKVIAFYTGTNEEAHTSFVREANRWFSEAARQSDFTYTFTTNWAELNDQVLARYQVVLFLESRPEDPLQRAAFRRYMEKGGAWMGFHFAGFALTPSAVPQNWDWYHQEFLGAGSYAGNTWRPTSAILRVEERRHPATRHLPESFKSAPNEWYKWTNDLRTNSSIKILLSIDPASYPLGTGPKAHEIWHSGYYPVVWTNQRYRMLYFNMGHNDLDFDQKPNKVLSSTFASGPQNRLVLDSLLWLGAGKN